MKEYFKPHFLSGVKKYIERGDTFPIENLEMFVLNCVPENGFVNNNTNVIFKFGLAKEECLQKILNDDNKFVQNLVQKEDEADNNTQLFTSVSRENEE